MGKSPTLDPVLSHKPDTEGYGEWFPFRTGSSIISGVPQGSVVGPLLFLILMGDIDRDIAHAFVSSFADDTRLSRAVSGVRDASSLQTELEIIYQWSVENNMSFNGPKFEVVRYGSDDVLKCTTSSLVTQVPMDPSFLTKTMSEILL